MNNKTLYERILDDNNIYLAIYAIDSYIFEKDLLEESDIKLLYSLRDIYNEKLIAGVIKKVKTKLKKIIEGDEFFSTSVYLRPKKINKKTKNIVFRPLHTADLYSQIGMVAMFNVLIYDIDQNGLKFNEVGRIIPSNFYGNILSQDANKLYVPWQEKYREYSNAITEGYSHYADTGEYQDEVCLDIEEFFPSINPSLVYQMLYEKFKVKYDTDDREQFKNILLKLVYLEVNELYGFDEQYYGDNNQRECSFCRGIPQGLPVSYFFANVVMTRIAKIFEESFTGIAYYYVDDSVMYVNGVEDEQKFKEKIDEINKKIKEWSEKEVGKVVYPDKDIYKKITRFNEQCKYIIKVHKDEKSNYSRISGDKQGEVSLKIMSKMASKGVVDLNSIFEDTDETILYNKFKMLTTSVEKELERIKTIQSQEKKFEYDQYKKMIIRFRKFFKFRMRIIEDRVLDSLNNDKEINSDEEVLISTEWIEIFLNSFNVENTEESKEKFFMEFDEDILSSKFSYLLRNSRDKVIFERVEKVLKKFNSVFYGEDEKNINVSYFYKIYTSIKFKKKINEVSNLKYVSLERSIKNKFMWLHNNNEKLAFIKKIISYIDKDIDNEENLKCKSCEEYKLSTENLKFKGNGSDKDIVYYYLYYMPMGIPYKLVDKLSDEMKRVVLNTILSIAINVEIGDSCILRKLDERPLSYLEVRILVYLRNKQFNFNKFVVFIKALNLDDKEIIDYGILQVLVYFKKLIKTPTKIDNLIQIHRYTTNMWKNGSKFLHFYTLHNQEHAIELIKASIKVIKSMDFLQITNLDYYILFIGCYLHDISMVVYPELSGIFNSKGNKKASLIYTEFEEAIFEKKFNLEYVPEGTTKALLVEYYKKIDQMYEEYIRSHHTKDSSRYIKQFKELKFIDDSILEVIAEISEAHGYDTKDIYDIKSVAKDSLVSKKFLKILLRMSDLLDMAENRVNETILDSNMKHMSKISQFHWISHKLIEGYDIITEYNNSMIDKKVIMNEEMSYIYKTNMQEIVTFVIRIKTSHLEHVKSKKCKHMHLVNDEDKGCLIIDINDDTMTQTCKSECNFICQWLSLKNEYLYNELFELQKYLRRSTNINCFTTKIKVKIEILDKEPLKQVYYDCLREKIANDNKEYK